MCSCSLAPRENISTLFLRVHGESHPAHGLPERSKAFGQADICSSRQTLACSQFGRGRAPTAIMHQRLHQGIRVHVALPVPALGVRAHIAELGRQIHLHSYRADRIRRTVRHMQFSLWSPCTIAEKGSSPNVAFSSFCGHTSRAAVTMWSAHGMPRSVVHRARDKWCRVALIAVLVL